jgi:hypothetical protein
VGGAGLELGPGHGVLAGVAVVLDLHGHVLRLGQDLLVGFRGDHELVLHRGVLPGVYAELLLELLADVLYYDRIPVLAAQDVVALGPDDLDVALRNPHDGHVEGASSKVVDHEGPLVGGLVESVCHGRRRGLVDDLEDLDAGGLSPRAYRGGALEVVEVGGDRDHRGVYLLPQGGLRLGYEVPQEHCGEVLGGVLPAEGFEGVRRVAHPALEGRGDGPGAAGLHVLGVLAYQDLPVLEEADD